MNKLELIDYFFRPKNVTLIGVSRNLMGASGLILSNIIGGGYEGPLHLINKNIPDGKKILGKTILKSIQEIDTDLDLTFIIVPSRVVPEVLEEVGDKNAKAVIVVSSGFAESISYDKEKLSLQDELVKIANKKGFVFTGPNCNGVYTEAISLNAIFGPRVNCLPGGSISYVTRGGTAGIHSMIETTIRGIGVSKNINLGDSANLEIQDFIEYYGNDPETKVIGCYTEGINNGRDFIEKVKKVNKIKPVVFFKSGNTQGGRKAAMSHVGAIASEFSESIYHGAVKQTGIIPVESLFELVDVCTAFMITYIPKGKRALIITPAGSLGVMCSDEVYKAGLILPTLRPDQIESFNKMLPEYWSHNNPIDLTDSMDFTIFGKIIKIMLKDLDNDGLIILFGDVSDDTDGIVNFGIEMDELDFFDTVVKDQVRKINKLRQRDVIAQKPVFFLGPVHARNKLPNFFRENKIICLPEYRKIARTFAAMAGWHEYTKITKIE